MPIEIGWDTTETCRRNSKVQEIDNDMYLAMSSKSCFRSSSERCLNDECERTLSCNDDKLSIQNKTDNFPYDSYIELGSLRNHMSNKSILLLLDKSAQVMYSKNRISNDDQHILKISFDPLSNDVKNINKF